MDRNFLLFLPAVGEAGCIVAPKLRRQIINQYPDTFCNETVFLQKVK